MLPLNLGRKEERSPSQDRNLMPPVSWDQWVEKLVVNKTRRFLCSRLKPERHAKTRVTDKRLEMRK